MGATREFERGVCLSRRTRECARRRATAEFHVWHSRTKVGADATGHGTDFASSSAALERSVLNLPDYLVFDLDPISTPARRAASAEPEYSNGAFDKCKETAFRLREVLQAMGLDPLVKPPARPPACLRADRAHARTSPRCERCAGLVGRHLLRQYPSLITMDWRIARRAGKIFLTTL